MRVCLAPSYVHYFSYFSKYSCFLQLDFIGIQISEEEGRLKKDEEETKEMWKRKREHEEQWEGTREQRVCFQTSQLNVVYISAQNIEWFFMYLTL